MNRYAESEELQAIYSAYLRPVLHRSLQGHPVWGSASKVHQLASSMLEVFSQVSRVVNSVQVVQYFCGLECLFVEFNIWSNKMTYSRNKVPMV